MKILIICWNGTDYLQSSIYLGLKDKFGKNVELYGDLSFLYQNCNTDPRHMWGLGFSYSKILDPRLYQQADNILQKIQDKYYDIIIYSFISRSNLFIDEVMKSSLGKNVFMVNGEDMDYDFTNYNSKGIYFKRELVEKKEKNILPISYAIHPSKITNNDIIKTQELSDSIPSMDNCTNISSSHYIFDNENDYYENYKKSYYGITKKKGGWDSMRHYEIMANKCVPLFENLENCPDLTLTTLPKKQLIEINEKYEERKINENDYIKYQNEIFQFCKENLTTDNLCNYILNFYE